MLGLVVVEGHYQWDVGLSTVHKLVLGDLRTIQGTGANSWLCCN